MIFLWIDCEMTGLDLSVDYILEIACILTDQNLRVLSEYRGVVFQDERVLSAMNQWCQNTHNRTGLVELVKKSKKTEIDIQAEILQMILPYSDDTIYMAGNSVYMDFNFIKIHMPKIIEKIHYRLFDVSTLKILAEKKNIIPFIKKKNHCALDDIKESIEELKYYEGLLL